MTELAGAKVQSVLGLPATLALLALTAAVAAFASRQATRPPNPSRGPRMIPWRGVMLTAVAAGLVLVVHLVNLLGVETGR